ncbi:KH domain-containing protein [Candidatus Dojkabacteria bacterium]|nr:KH domain-containing protein [Candidatus Dojkabacteria bacterium]
MSKITKSEIVKEAEVLLKDMMDLLGVEAETSLDMDTYDNEEGEEREYIKIKIDGDDLGILIGYLGKNLKSMQRVLTLMMNKQLKDRLEEGRYLKVVVDVSNYRESRKEHLEALANRVREEVLASGEEVDLPSMDAYERRIVHIYLKEFDDVTTESFGEGWDRHIKVMPIK